VTDAFAQDWYRVRRKVFKIFGGAFHVYDRDQHVIAYSKQAAFRLREDIRIFTDESMQTPLLTIQSRQIVDFSAAYDVVDAREGKKVGAARRKGWTSILRDSWELLDANDRPVGKVSEDSAGLALLRRFLTNLVPQRFDVVDPSGRKQADLDQRFNPFVYKLDVTVDSGSTIDRRLVLAAAVLIAAIEGRQG
jgi:uncharacterized protein YxjI